MVHVAELGHVTDGCHQSGSFEPADTNNHRLCRQGVGEVNKSFACRNCCWTVFDRGSSRGRSEAQQSSTISTRNTSCTQHHTTIHIHEMIEVLRATIDGRRAFWICPVHRLPHPWGYGWRRMIEAEVIACGPRHWGREAQHKKKSRMRQPEGSCVPLPKELPLTSLRGSCHPGTIILSYLPKRCRGV